LFASNVVYPVEPGAGLAARVLALNPVVSYIDAYRHLLLLGELPEPSRTLPGLVAAPVVLVLGALYFRRVAPRFAEEV
jgi:ABC-type polysaccharide/polyol phosphate export permease